MTDTTSTRRTVLCAMATIPVAGLSTAAIAGAVPATIDRAEWDQAFAQHKKASAVAEAFDKDVGTPAYEAWEAAQKEVAHARTVHSYQNMLGERICLTTESTASVTNARQIVEGRPGWATMNEEYFATSQELVELADAREAELERRLAACNVHEVTARCDALSDAEGDAWRRLIYMPAPDAAALMWKMEELWGDEGGGSSGGWSMDIVEPVLADARRLLGVEGV